MTAGVAPRGALGARRASRVIAAAAGTLVVLLTGATIAQATLAHRLSPTSFNGGAALILTIWVIAAVDLDSVRDDLASVLRVALAPAHVSVWIRGGE